MTYPLVKRVSHRMLGDMLRMMLSERLFFDLTLEEGRTLSRAFTAVAYDWRRTDLIYLSPVGSDDEFSAAVTQAGIDVETADGGHHLSWDDVTELAERLVVSKRPTCARHRQRHRRAIPARFAEVPYVHR
jgi:hypothetical protein